MACLTAMTPAVVVRPGNAKLRQCESITLASLQIVASNAGRSLQ